MGLLPQALVQIEIHVSNLDQATKFYEQTFGWKSSPAELHNYVVLEVPPECGWGISLVPTRTKPNTATPPVVLYFKVENAAAIAQKAEASGGRKLFGPTSLPAYGQIWQVTDPDGHRYGLFEKASTQVPTRTTN
jgi:predicted enzyme related to lactoylglutathione lyase